MRAVICALAKNENAYINDGVNGYLNIGFSHIYIFDNNDKDTAYVGNFIVQKDRVTIFDVREQHQPYFQQQMYEKFYQEYKDTFDGVLFCDIDEFLGGTKDINRLLGNLPKRTEQIRIKGRLFGDDNLVDRPRNIPIYEAIKKPVLHSMNRNLKQRGNLERQGKCMVKGGLNNIIFRHVHAARRPSNHLITLLPMGQPASDEVVIKEVYNQPIWLHHYMTKTLAEFCEQKLNRGDAVAGTTSLKLDYYGRINQQTPAKIKWLRDHGYME